MNTEPASIIALWRRFSCGLWRVPEGDVSEAYSADTMPRVKAFTHEGRLYTNGGGHSKWLLAEVNAYLLIHPDEYQGPDSVPYSYEGKTITYQGEPYRLGPKTLFVASDPTLAEWRHLCRVLYADGGYFASGCKAEKIRMEKLRERKAARLEANRQRAATKRLFREQ
jgi:hypothetical protein